MTISFRSAAVAFLLALPLAAGCSRGDDGFAHAATSRPAAVAPAAPVPGSHVDSILSPEEEIRRFREGLAEPAALTGGERSREALVRAFTRAVERADTAAVRRMIVSRAEFAYLYYPSTEFTHSPRRMAPALLWFLTLQESEKGIGRLFQRRGGQSMGYVSTRCDPRPRAEGRNRLWDRCRVTLRHDGEAKSERLFGTIIERDGEFKFLSYKNEF
ncbi:MAG TPA: hypothetical protein VFJ16_10330 [Longimicrobium sp.]|nr:hypothetical protein [Longimicrobium sp.]